MTNPDAPLAVLYLRVSTKDQAERGGEAEGFSIPAQREAGRRKAEALGAIVAAEFVDAGESARSADRPELQKMLAFISEEQTVRYVIVHKVDRLARNRFDDVEINLAITKAGASLVSCTENIDETPSGMLLHGIMSSIAEFYSRNLANEVIKGTQQKVMNGGTPTLAPVGYLNVRRMVDGREVRTVEVDAERAPHIKWAFEAYATGEWTQRRVAQALELRGLTVRATARRLAKPLSVTKVSDVLRNPYYVGVVTWRGMQFDGKHPKLVSPELFGQVQDVLEAHRTSSERSYRRRNYLTGTLRCDHCDSKLMYSVSTGRRGDKYDYWVCLGRHKYKNGCEAPALPGPAVEQAVIDHWHSERLTEDEASTVRTSLMLDLHEMANTQRERTSQLDRRIQRIQRERAQWAIKVIEGLVPDDIARTKQTELAEQLARAQGERGQQDLTAADHEDLIRRATVLLPDCGVAYRAASDRERRDYNQAWFSAVYVAEIDGRSTVTRADRTDFFEALMTATVHPMPRAVDTNDSEPMGPGHLRARVISRVRGSNVACLVELRGFEPLTPSMRTRCATRLRHSPKRDSSGYHRRPAVPSDGDS